MAKRVMKVLILGLSMVLAATAVSGVAQAGVSDAIPFDCEGKNVRVEIYSRDVGDTANSPVFKYGDLLNRAIRYKDANPDTEVTVRFAMYVMSSDVYIGFNPEDPASYGQVRDHDFAEGDSEKLTYSLVKAARHKVDVDFVYQKDAYGEQGTVLGFLNGLMDEECVGDPACHVRDHLSARKVSWGEESAQQMHAKYMTVSHHLGDGGTAVTDTTYVTTANVDNHDAHAEGRLNFDDRHFRAYFFPIPTGTADAWDTAFNPVAKYVDQMSTVSGDRYLKANMFHLKSDAFGQRLHAELKAIHDSPGPELKHFRFLVQRNTNEENWSIVDHYGDIGRIAFGVPTHTKNTQFAFSGPREYYSITGSANLKYDENTSKANSSLVIKEFTTEHPVYDEYKRIYGFPG